MARTRPVASLALDAIRGQVAEIELRAAALREGSAAEDVHQARVAVRRLRSALAFFRDYLEPSWQDLHEDLRWVAGLMGAVRDIDVQVSRIRAWIEAAALPPEAAKIVEALSQERTAAMGDARGALASDRFEVLLKSLGRRLAVQPPESPPASEALPRLLKRRMARLRGQARELPPGAPPETFHRARILAKRLRYAAEFAQPIYGNPARRLARAVVPVQDRLGWRQDADVARARLRELAERRPELAFACGELAQVYQAQAAECEAAWLAPYRGLRRAYRRLGKVL